MPMKVPSGFNGLSLLDCGEGHCALQLCPQQDSGISDTEQHTVLHFLEMPFVPLALVFSLPMWPKVGRGGVQGSHHFPAHGLIPPGLLGLL